MKINFKLQNHGTMLASLVIVFLVASACNPAQNQAAFDLTNAKKEIEAANQNLMDLLSKSDSTGVADCYASNAKLMGPNAPAITGKENIRGMFGSFIKGGITKLDLKAIDVWGTPEIVTEEGEVTISTKEGNQVDKGKYIVVWKKEDGKWKIFRDIFNSDLPPPAAK